MSWIEHALGLEDAPEAISGPHVVGERFRKSYNGVDLDKECIDHMTSYQGDEKVVVGWLLASVYMQRVVGEPILQQKTEANLIGLLENMDGERADEVRALIAKEKLSPSDFPKGSIMAIRILIGSFE